MKKWWKIVLGLLIIAAALYAMHLWNEQGRERLREAEAEIETVISPVPEKTAKELAIEKGKSFFPIPRSWIAAKSSQLAVGDWVCIYAEILETQNSDGKGDEKTAMPVSASAITKLGDFEVAVILEEALEIICDIDSYLEVKNAVNTKEANLILVMEAALE